MGVEFVRRQGGGVFEVINRPGRVARVEGEMGTHPQGLGITWLHVQSPRH